MISYATAIEIIQEASSNRSLGTETLSLENCLGRVCAQDIASPLDIQPFDNSAMDGFAVKMTDLQNAKPEQPITLKKAGILPAGENSKGIVLQTDTCWHVMTGAMLPEGTEAIVPIENAIIDGDEIKFNDPPKFGQHIRRAGEDFKKGASVLLKGESIKSIRIMPLATLGISKLSVFKRPKVLFITTGTELIDNLSQPLESGQIYNSNRFYADAFLTQCGVEVHTCPAIRDNAEQFKSLLKSSETENYDLVISSGAVSAGSYDFVKDELESFGAKVLYHKIKLKPGKPNLFARLPSGALYFGLPGNPVATAVGLRFFVLEALRIMQKRQNEKPVFARAKNSFSKKSGLHMILKGKLEYSEDGCVNLIFLDGQESFMVSPFLCMNGWAHIPEKQETVKPGDIVEVYPALFD